MDWFSMGGYGAYVWPAYGFVVFVFVFQMIKMKIKGKRLKRHLESWFKN